MERDDRTKTSLSYRKDMKTVYQIARRLRGESGQNQDLTVIWKGYEDRLPDNKKTTWRERTEPRPHCNIERI